MLNSSCNIIDHMPLSMPGFSDCEVNPICTGIFCCQIIWAPPTIDLPASLSMANYMLYLIVHALFDRAFFICTFPCDTVFFYGDMQTRLFVCFVLSFV